MSSFSDDKISLFGLNVVGQLAHSLDCVVQRVGLRVIDVDVDNPMDIEGNIQVDTTCLFVGETVLVFSGCLGLYLLVPVIQICFLQHHLAVRGRDLGLVSIMTIVDGYTGCYIRGSQRHIVRSCEGLWIQLGNSLPTRHSSLSFRRSSAFRMGAITHCELRSL